MSFSLFRKKADKDKLDKASKNSSFASLPRNGSFNSIRRGPTPPVIEQEERYIQYNIEPETSKAPAPDTRMLKSLGGCAVQVSTVTVETFDAPLPYLVPRRDSNMSAASSTSTNLTTPTFSREPEWERNLEMKLAEQDEEPVPEVFIEDEPKYVQSFSHRFGGSSNGEVDLNALLSMSGGTKANSASPFGFATLGNKPAVKPKPRRVFEDDDDFYVPGFQAAVRSRAL